MRRNSSVMGIEWTYGEDSTFRKFGVLIVGFQQTFYFIGRGIWLNRSR